ncbi:hypothetical protein SPRG_17151 [Saprolegnia parasitica CBS 223.65]|uniref:Uncharacterized protein n=1 Tax=Saprolegnia parasitica (strain CBS 223.65) TaxID=695850 RepID=A0A067BRE3_SAPPC|nr:hypothetical protein SPRG_17151 [Saprolegnia parasitica CBS 223.65]KDO17207.1 hypothetical protein SPRG_17151 [Saprolegnia parasitica CBS 223.65]|eukprot:XP_012212087.1 hypothetical protein SPRG_17151 [Saprolegnia parasitica CBS 223.65]
MLAFFNALVKNLVPSTSDAPVMLMDVEEVAACTASYEAMKAPTWDDKRQTCANCKHVFLKALSPAKNYCSVDCKSNAVYLEGIQRAIQAMKNAVASTDEPVKAPVDVVAPLHEMQLRPVALGEAHTFAEYHTEKLAGKNVEWSFSALY